VVQLQDEERRRIARELHDSIGQHLTAIAMSVSTLEGRVRPELRPEVKEILRHVDTCIKDVRTISHLLHPPLLDEVGLSSALEWYVGEFSRRGGIHVDLEMPPELGRMKPEVETAIFRIVQESLTNIHRHSGAQKARISIGHGNGKVKISISDGGRGISKEVLKTNCGWAIGRWGDGHERTSKTAWRNISNPLEWTGNYLGRRTAI
jgi:two-component system, NarL family, sensor kinase